MERVYTNRAEQHLCKGGTFLFPFQLTIPSYAYDITYRHESAFLTHKRLFAMADVGVKKAVQRWGKLDIFVSNAGVFRPAEFLS
jgi:NAD(P)-dependent dehydrogenase (short-subunit alcohol dehydrogenase family)